MMKSFFTVVFSGLLFLGCSSTSPKKTPAVKTGAEVLLEKHLDEIGDQRVGLVMNPTSRVDGVHMLDTLLQRGIQVTALFAAEHGFRGELGAGEKINDGIDEATGLPVFSLYGKNRKPTPEMLAHVDLLLFDLPDMGVRFYTYNSTMGLVLEATAEAGKEMWILDRPNPLGGNYMAGWKLKDEYKSFVGSYPMPSVYGLTMAEIAQMAIGEGWLEFEQPPKLKIIKAENWERDMRWPDTNLPWIAPSPNLPTFEHAFMYPGTVIFEGTNVSEGRGTPDPFLTIGSPTLSFSQEELASLAAKHNVRLDSITFTPASIPGKAISPKLQDELCTGIRIYTDGAFDKIDPFELGMDLLLFVQAHDPGFEMNTFANKLSGINLKAVMDTQKSLPSWQNDVEAFSRQRAPYLLYSNDL